MATLVATTTWSHTKGAGASFTVTLTQAAAAGNTLVLATAGGALATVTGWTKRTTYGNGVQDVSIQDKVAVGGETTVAVTLNGDENVSGIVYELAGVGAFIAASNNGAGAAVNNSMDNQSSPSAITVASGNAVLVGLWSVATTTAFSVGNRWRQMGPLGRLLANAGNQAGTGLAFIWASGLADVSASGKYPANLAAGQYQATSCYLAAGTGFAAQAAYADASGVPTNPAVNAIVGENSLPGTRQENWSVNIAGTNSTIAGYTDQASYAPGNTVNFKVDSTSNPFRVEIYRLGFYGFELFGARNVLGNQAGYIAGTVTAQPAPTVDSTLGSTSCAWTTNASWTIPAGTPPGLYYVLLRRTDVTSNVSSAQFIVRGTATAKTAVVLPDWTWQAYNIWGATTDNGSRSTGVWTGRSLYQAGQDAGTAVFGHRSYGVSFDRPWSTHATQANTGLFDSELPWIMFAEAQGYDLSYFSTFDLDANVTLLNTANAVVLLGHHEYWTTNVYDCLTHARDVGVNLAVFGSNIALWHTRFAAADTSRRTLICYKDSGTKDVSAGFAGTGYDPVSYTGTWRDTRTVAGQVNNTDIRRENSLTGQIFVASGPVALAHTVPAASKGKPIWRNAAAIQALTSGQSYTVTGANSLGDEVDIPDGSAGQPANLVTLCPTPMSTTTAANAAGTIYTTTVNTTATFTLYRAGSGALVFNTGAWRAHQPVTRWRNTGYNGTAVVDLAWQNAMLAILYDLGITPAAPREMQPGTDTVPTDPSIGAPAGGRPGVAVAYGLTVPTGSGGFLAFFT